MMKDVLFPEMSIIKLKCKKNNSISLQTGFMLVRRLKSENFKGNQFPLSILKRLCENRRNSHNKKTHYFSPQKKNNYA